MKKRKRTRVIVVLILLGLALYWWTRSDRAREPDDRLAAHIDAVCAIAGDNVDDPSRGVDRLFAYFGKNSPDMLRQLGDLVVLIQRIDDEDAHDRRALRAHERLARSLRACERPMGEFLEAVEDDPEAADKLVRGINRLNRALELLIGGSSGGALPFGLPSPARLLTRDIGTATAR